VRYYPVTSANIAANFVQVHTVLEAVAAITSQPCPSCKGTGRWRGFENSWNDWNCRGCAGTGGRTGRVPAHVVEKARALVGEPT